MHNGWLIEITPRDGQDGHLPRRVQPALSCCEWKFLNLLVVVVAAHTTKLVRKRGCALVRGHVGLLKRDLARWAVCEGVRVVGQRHRALRCIGGEGRAMVLGHFARYAIKRPGGCSRRAGVAGSSWVSKELSAAPLAT